MKMAEAITLALGAVVIEMVDDGKVIVRDYDADSEMLTVFVMARVGGEWCVEQSVLPISGMHGGSVAVH